MSEAAPSGTVLEAPAWWRELSATFQDGTAHCFALHWNVTDYVSRDVELATYIDLCFAHREFVVHYSLATGLTFGGGPKEEERRLRFCQIVGIDPAAIGRFRDPAGVLPLLTTLLRAREEKSVTDETTGEKKTLKAPVKCVVLIDYAESIWPEADWNAMNGADRTAIVTLLSWARDREIGLSGIPVILIARHLADLHRDLRAASSGLYAIEVPSPDYAARLEHIEFARATVEARMEAEGHGGSILAVDAPQFARLAAGLHRRHIDDILWSAKRAGEQVTDERIKSRKKQIIASEYGEVIEIWEPDFGFEAVGGLEHCKQFFERNVIRPMRQGNRARCPQGILMMGPSGTGKSHLARAVAYESGINCVKFDPSKLFDSLVGSSERNLRRALAGVMSFAPCLLFLDEIDQTGVQRDNGGDGGVSGRVFGMFIDWMADPSLKGNVVLLAATNRPDLLDPAFKAPHRFSKKLPLLPPDAAERALILQVLFERTFGEHLPPDFGALAERTEGWTPAELRALTEKACEIEQDEGEGDTAAVYEAAMACYRPTTQQLRQWTRLALDECNDLSLLPPGFRELLNNPEKLAEELPAVTAGRAAREL